MDDDQKCSLVSVAFWDQKWDPVLCTDCVFVAFKKIIRKTLFLVLHILCFFLDSSICYFREDRCAGIDATEDTNNGALLLLPICDIK